MTYSLAARVVHRFLHASDEAAPQEEENPSYFWGSMGAGGLFYAIATRRVCVQKRSSGVNEPGTWGTWGGAVDANESVKVGLKRELKEETGYSGSMRLEPVSTFTKANFKYHNFLVFVPTEFNPKHSWETSDHAWVDIDDLPSPLHFGLKAALVKYKAKIKKFESK